MYQGVPRARENLISRLINGLLEERARDIALRSHQVAHSPDIEDNREADPAQLFAASLERPYRIIRLYEYEDEVVHILYYALVCEDADLPVFDMRRTRVWYGGHIVFDYCRSKDSSPLLLPRFCDNSDTAWRSYIQSLYNSQVRFPRGADSE